MTGDERKALYRVAGELAMFSNWIDEFLTEDMSVLPPVNAIEETIQRYQDALIDLNKTE